MHWEEMGSGMPLTLLERQSAEKVIKSEGMAELVEEMFGKKRSIRCHP